MMRKARRHWTWLALAATTLGTLGLTATGGPTAAQDPAGKQADDADKAPAKEKDTDKDRGKARGRRGGLRLVPRNAPEKAEVKNLPDPLRPGAAAGAMPNAPGQAAAPGAGAGANPANPAAGGQAQPGAANAPGAAGNANPNPNAPNQPQGLPKWPFHYTVKLAAPGNAALAASYYPAEKPFEAPVLLMLHETGQGRSGKDFEDPLLESAEKTGFVQRMQKQGYAVLILDLRGHGLNPRHELTAAEWQAMTADLQAAYNFLVDRHNRGELNLGKFGVVALGDTGNLAAAWAATPGGAVSDDPTDGGRISDLGALVLVSPVADARGLPLARILPQIAPRFPMMLVSGDRDDQSIAPVRAAQPIVERHRLSRVAYLDTNLHGMKLLRFFPKAADAIEKFLDDPVKFRTVEWEPRYLLQPPEYGEVKLVADSGVLAPAQAGNANANPAVANPAAGAANPNPAQPKAANKKGAARKNP